MELNSRMHTSVPVIYHKLLPRSNIAQIIDCSMLNEIICLTAPYGCGKTLAVLSWLQKHDMQAYWINLNENTSNTLETFLSETISKPIDYGREKILVIDNFQYIRDMDIVRRVKDFILTHLSDWRIIIISRVELPPSFNELIFKNRIRLITPKELNFSLQETEEYFAMNGYSVSESDISKIHSETEGWPAALNALLAASRGGSVSYGETARDYIMTFFETEIWNGLGEDVKDFLMKTCVFEKLTPSSCYAVTGIGTALPMLKWLLVNGIFISKLAEEDTYRYHRVFRDFLLVKLSESDISETQLYSKIAWWFFERSETAQSFPYFFKAGDYYGMNQTLKILNPAEMGIEKFLEMAVCMTALKAEDLKSYPILVARIALIHFLIGNLEEMQRLSAIFKEWLETETITMTSEEYKEYIWEAGWLNYIDPAEPVLNNKYHEEWSNYEEYILHLKPVHLQRFAVLRMPSAIRGIRDYCPSVSTVDMFLKHNEDTNFSIIRGEYALCEMQLISAEYAYELENFARAEEKTKKVMITAESSRNTDLCFVCTILLVKIMRATNNTKKIDALVNSLESMIIDNNYHFILPNFHAFQLRNRLMDGETGFTEIFLEENIKYKDQPYYYLLYRHLAYVRGLISLGNYNEAMLVLGNIEMLCNKYMRTMDLMEVNILKAAALYGLGNEDKACVSLAEAINSSKEYGYIRIFSDDADALLPVLEILRKQMNNKYVQNIIASCKKTLQNTGHKISGRKYSHIELTKTELKILKSLQANMSYIEIALDNDIRISTVKSHITSIYSKLEVDNKTSAIIAAKSRGLIDE